MYLPAMVGREGKRLLVWLVWLAGCGARATLDAGAEDGAGGAASGGGGATTGTQGTGASGAGTTGSTGTTGTGGNPPQISVVDACTIAVSCGGDAGWGDGSVSHCVDGFARLGWSFEVPSLLSDPVLAARILACAAEAGSDCDTFRACYGGDWVSVSRCREGAYCDGALLTAAPTGPTFDCGTLGATCQDLWSGALRACCNAEPCAQSTGVECAGTVASYCGGWGEHVTFDCGESGRTCQPDLEAPCLGAGGPCDENTTKTTCAGGVATYCSGGKLAEYDCASTAYLTACADGALAYEGPCRPEYTECTVWDGGCSGGSLIACLDGQSTAISCAGLGFSGCDASGSVARCVN